MDTKTKIIYFCLGGECHKPMRIGDGKEATYKCMYEFLLAGFPLAGFFKAALLQHKSAVSRAELSELKQQGHCRISSRAARYYRL